MLALSGVAARADNQTPTTTPITVGGQSLPFGLKLQRVDTGGRLPTLQSFAAAQYGNLWVLFGGRTNGLHDFTSDPLKNFPPSEQNRSVWVIDPSTWQVWSRSIKDSGLTGDQVDQLSATNYEHYQVGNTFYIVGGYGYDRSEKKFVTFPVMTAMDLPALVNWVQEPAKSPRLAKLIRQTERRDPAGHRRPDEHLRQARRPRLRPGLRRRLWRSGSGADLYRPGPQLRHRRYWHELSITKVKASPTAPDLTNLPAPRL